MPVPQNRFISSFFSGEFKNNDEKKKIFNKRKNCSSEFLSQNNLFSSSRITLNEIKQCFVLGQKKKEIEFVIIIKTTKNKILLI